MKKHFILLLFVSSIMIGNAQKPEDSAVASSKFEAYNRSGLTWVYLETPSRKMSGDVTKALKYDNMVITERFDDNRIKDYKVKLKSAKKSKETLMENRIANKVMGLLAGNDMSYNEAMERAKYTMTDSDAKEFMASRTGVNSGATRKWFEPVLQSNYILAYEVGDVITYKEYYDKIDRENKKRAAKSKNYEYKPVNRTKTGYKSSITVHIHKIVYNDSISSVMGETVFKSENPVIQRRAMANFDFPLEHIVSKTYGIDGGVIIEEAERRKLKKDDFFAIMLSPSKFRGLIAEMENEVEEFKIKATIFGVKPLLAKIGLKEGIGTDRRFFVYEQIMKEDGDIKEKRVGVVRAKNHVIDNREVAQGDMDPSEFYQIQGRKLDLGMMMQEQKDMGSTHFGFGTAGINFKYDLLMSEYFGDFTYGLRAYIDLNFAEYHKFDKGYITKDRDISKFLGEDSDVGLVGLSVGLGKDFHFMRSFFAGPLLGVQFEGAAFTNSDVDEFLDKTFEDNETVQIEGISYETYGTGKITYKAGLRMGMYINHRFKVIASIYNTPVGFKETDFFGPLSEFYIDRSPIRANVALGWDVSF
jgi:hypothetical protein